MEIKAELIGKCGIYCGACPLHIGGICKGCSDVSTTKCSIYKCVNERNLNSCGECPEFPCKLHFHEKTAVYARGYLNWKRREL